MPLITYLVAGTTFALGTGALLYTFQTEIIYPARYRKKSRQFVTPKFAEDGIPFSETTLITEDKVRIKAYVCKRPTDEEARQRPTILVLHGNRGNVGRHSVITAKFYNELKCNVVLLSYRGYGHSEGKPTEKGIKIDAQTCLNYIKRHSVLKDTKLVIYGRSLGGAVAIDLVSRNEDMVEAMVVENTFLSIPKLIPTFLPLLRYFSFLCSQIWPSEQSITKIRRIPVLFLSSGKDKLVPKEQMKKLYDLIDTEGGKAWKGFPNGQHADTINQHGYFETIEEFLRWSVDKDEVEIIEE